jgi:chorismate mutase
MLKVRSHQAGGVGCVAARASWASALDNSPWAVALGAGCGHIGNGMRACGAPGWIIGPFLTLRLGRFPLPMDPLRLEDLRGKLIRQEETIIFALIERAQFKRNLAIYQPGVIPLPEYEGDFSDYLLHQTEIMHAQVRRYTSPDEHPFTAPLPVPVLPAMAFPQQIRPNHINLNPAIRLHYRDQILPAICAEGDCQNYGSSAVCDVACLQALSKRIHYGKFIAEAKFQSDVPLYTRLIGERDSEGILAALTDASVEARLLRRVELKGATYGQDPEEPPPPAGAPKRYKIPPTVITAIYRDWIIPMTKEVEIIYLLDRLKD